MKTLIAAVLLVTSINSFAGYEENNYECSSRKEYAKEFLIGKLNGVSLKERQQLINVGPEVFRVIHTGIAYQVYKSSSKATPDRIYLDCMKEFSAKQEPQRGEDLNKVCVNVVADGKVVQSCY